MKLLDQVRDVMRKKHYSIRTEHAYITWIRQYILFHNKCHLRDMGKLSLLSFWAISLMISSWIKCYQLTIHRYLLAEMGASIFMKRNSEDRAIFLALLLDVCDVLIGRVDGAVEH
jgi:uncharacterized membrane protein